MPSCSCSTRSDAFTHFYLDGLVWSGLVWSVLRSALQRCAIYPLFYTPCLAPLLFYRVIFIFHFRLSSLHYSNFPLSSLFGPSAPSCLLICAVIGWLAESGIKSGDWLYRPEPSTLGYHNVTSTFQNVTTTTLESYDINNDILMRSAFSHFYQMDKIGIFKQFFATLFPILLIIVMFLVVTNILNFILVKCKLDYMQMGTCKNAIQPYRIDLGLPCHITSYLLRTVFLMFLLFSLFNGQYL